MISKTAPLRLPADSAGPLCRESPLWGAFAAGDWAEALHLVRSGTDIAVADTQGHTPLMVAAGHAAAIGVLHALLDAGVAVDTRNALGWTALMVAALAGNTVGVYALLQGGADSSLTDDRFDTARDIALSAGQDWIARILSRGGRVPGRDLPGPTSLAVAVQISGEKPRAAKPFADFAPQPKPVLHRKPQAPVHYGRLGSYLMAQQPPKPVREPEALDLANRPLRSTKPLIPNATRSFGDRS
jgi:hypothetical protein